MRSSKGGVIPQQCRDLKSMEGQRPCGQPVLYNVNTCVRPVGFIAVCPVKFVHNVTSIFLLLDPYNRGVMPSPCPVFGCVVFSFVRKNR